MHIHRSLGIASILAFVAGPVFAQASTDVQARRQEIDSAAQTTLDGLINKEAAVKDLYGRAAGYAVFTVTKGGFIVSGGGGNGVAVDKGSGQRTYMRMGMAGVGLGIGGQRYGLVILFETADRLNKFVAGGWDSSATAEAVAGQEGVATPHEGARVPVRLTAVDELLQERRVVGHANGDRRFTRIGHRFATSQATAAAVARRATRGRRARPTSTAVRIWSAGRTTALVSVRRGRSSSSQRRGSSSPASVTTARGSTVRRARASG